MGKLLEQSILDYYENSFSRNIPHSTLTTLLCIKGGVTFSETEEKCPRASPLTLTRVLKTLAQGEEVERVISKKLIDFLVHFSDLYYNIMACFYAEICTIDLIYILQKFTTEMRISSKDQK